MTMRNARIDKTINHPRFDETVEAAPGSFGRAMGLGTDDDAANTFVDGPGTPVTGAPVGGWGIGALEESKAEGCVHGESFVLTRRLYHRRS